MTSAKARSQEQAGAGRPVWGTAVARVAEVIDGVKKAVKPYSSERDTEPLEVSIREGMT